MQSDFFNNMPVCETLNHDIPFVKSQKILVKFPVEDHGKFYGYINNLITFAVYINNNLEIIITAPFMVIHAMNHS